MIFKFYFYDVTFNTLSFDFFYKSAFYPKTIAELNVIMNNYKVKKIFTLALTT